MRCLTLAQALSARGVSCGFLCRRADGDLIDWMREQSYFQQAGFFTLELAPDVPDVPASVAALQALPARPAWLVVDHYQLDADWERAIRPYAGKILAIDDLADRPHACHLLLDQNLHPDTQRYAALLTPECQPLLGPAFALLRPEFLSAREGLSPRNGDFRRLVVSFGGSDPQDETGKTLKAIQTLENRTWTAEVVIGGQNARRKALEAQCAAITGVRAHVNVSYMAELMAQADLMVGAGGTTSWERACLGLPALVTLIAENQRELTRHLSDRGVVRNLGAADDVSPEAIAEALLWAEHSPDWLREASRAGMALVDGHGAARVVAAMGF